MNRTEQAESSGKLRTLLSRLSGPADDWAYQGDEQRASVLTLLMVALLVLVLVAAALVFTQTDIVARPGVSVLVGLVFVTIGAIVGLLMVQVRRYLVGPLAQLYTWALRMCDGDFEARIPSEQPGRFAKLSFHINRLSEALDRLANEMDDVVWEQTARLQHKNRSIELLYEVAAATTSPASLKELLERAARQLMAFFDASAASVQLVATDREPASVFAVGEVPSDRAKPLPLADVVEVGETQIDDDLGFIRIPLTYQAQRLGKIELFVSPGKQTGEPDTRTLLDNVGRHLGMAIAKSRLDDEAQEAVLMRERSSLAYELHDSLAQSIAGLKYQISNLSESVEQVDSASARRELSRVRASLDSINTEVRELIANFRVPAGEGGLKASMQDMVSRFASDTGISARFQDHCDTRSLSTAAELQVLGITREALANIRKHSDASSVRVLLHEQPPHTFRLLIEDDGHGMLDACSDGTRGEHIGLEIMRERAERLGGSLRVESEPGDGTRVELVFDHPTQAGRRVLDHAGA